MDEKKGFWFLAMSRTNYPIKSLIVLSLFFVGYAYLMWHFYEQKMSDVREVEIEIRGNRLQRPLRHLLEKLETGSIRQEEIDQINRLAYPIQITWNGDKEDLFRQLTELSRQVGYAAGLAYDDNLDNYHNLDTTLTLMPSIQRHLIEYGKTKEDRYLILLQNDLDKAKRNMSRLPKRPFSQFPPFAEALQRFIEHPSNDIQGPMTAFWDEAIDQAEKDLQIQKRDLLLSLWIPLGISLSLALIGFCLGFYFISNVIRQLDELKRHAKRYTEGDLSSRAHVRYHDEAGEVAIAFNQLSAHFETVIGELKHLLEAIKRLAKGDFSVRVQVQEPKSEMGQVCLSFNQMAENYGNIIGRLRELGINLASSASQISSASHQQEKVITEQEATTREISVTAHEISTTAKQFASTMNEVSGVADRTASLASTGKESLQQMVEIMEKMCLASGQIASKLAILNEKASHITSVMTTIAKVADQTNLLSLNAAIEAEKAGEFGKSFAVIAKEIRRLADLTAVATLDIEKIVDEIMSALSKSVIGVDEFKEEIKNGGKQVSAVTGHLSTIIEQVQVLHKEFESVNKGMQAQAVGAEQIHSAISLLNRSAKETSNSLAGFRHTLQQLNMGATDLRSAVDKIRHDPLT